MAIWQMALLALAFVWGLQSLGVWFQMRHYGAVFKGLKSEFDDGFMGAGHTRGRLRHGSIALLVVDSELVVRRLLTMTGRTIFAKFRRHPEVEGLTLGQLAAAQGDPLKSPVASSIIQAVEHVRKISAAKAA